MTEINKISELLSNSAELKSTLSKDHAFLESVSKGAKIIIDCIKSGGTIYVCGNGGSACDAMHFVEELVARYKRDRRGFRAMHFMDASTLTCWSNDYDYSSAFERQAETFCQKNDVLVAISTSGKSTNINAAAEAAKIKGSKVIALTGKSGGELKNLCDVGVIVKSEATERIQEVHITVIHIWCELIETQLVDI